MLIRGSPHLTPWLFLKKKEGKLFQWIERHGVKDYLFFGYGRIALLAGLKILGYGKGGNVLLPAYICDVTAEPFYELGVEVRFYEVLENLQPDIADVKRRIDQKTKTILAVNYFGFPQRLDEIQGVCRERGLALIEDNAHGFLSKQGSRLLGTFGDIGFASIWKALPVANGAVLYINNERLLQKQQDCLGQDTEGYLRAASSRKYILSSILAYLEAQYKFPSQYFRNAYNKFASGAERNSTQDYQRAKVRISGLSVEVMKRVEPEEVISKRRGNYRFWLDKLEGKGGISIIFKNLPEGVCPQVFPIIAEDAENLEAKLLSKGVYVDHWPWLPREVEDNKEYPTANFLAKHLLVLPVHQNTDVNCLERATRGIDFT